ncbi:acyl carrier protein [Gammaproteobacteria bacterium]|nr:acyl carrier protein [Gammaproteobacteria bacterium]
MANDTVVDLPFIFKIFRDSLELDHDVQLTAESAFEEVPGWDSLGHMRIIAQLEEELDIEFEIEEIVDQDTVQKILDLVTAKV